MTYTVIQRNGGSGGSTSISFTATTQGSCLIINVVSDTNAAGCTAGGHTLLPGAYGTGHNNNYAGIFYLPPSKNPGGITSATVTGCYAVGYIEVSGITEYPAIVAGYTSGGNATPGTSFAAANPGASASNFTVFVYAYDVSNGGTYFSDGSGSAAIISNYGQYSYTLTASGFGGTMPSGTYDCVSVSFAPASSPGVTPSVPPPAGVFRGSCGNRIQNVGETGSVTPQVGILAYEQWLGRPVRYVLDFMTHVPTTWAQFENGFLDQGDTNCPYVNDWGTLLPRWTMVLGVPVCAGKSIGSGGTTWAAEAAGTNDSHWTTLGNNLISWGYGNAIIRLGREFNGNWYNWSPAVSGDTIAQYQAGWQHIVTLLRGLTGSNLKFMWNPTIGMVSGETGSSQETTNWYPGNAYVDSIGIDIYDWGNPSGTYPTQTSAYTTPSAAEQQTSFYNDQNEDDGLLGMARFAQSCGKPFAMPEWGLQLWTSGTTYAGGGDNPYFINQMANVAAYTFMQALWEDTGMGVYDTDADARRTSGLAVPNSRAAYLAAFSVVSGTESGALTDASTINEGVSDTDSGAFSSAEFVNRGYPSASTTGPAAGGYASPTSVTISTATTLSAANSWAIAGTGAQTGYLVVSNVTFTMGAELTVTAAKVIFQGCTFNSTVTATTNGPTMITCTGAGPYTFTYCTFCGTTSQRVNLLLNQGADAAFTVNYCNFYYMRQAIQLFTGTTAGVLIENSYFHDIVLYGSDHSEPIYVGANGGCSNITINANTIENPLSQTAAVYFYPIYAFYNCTITNNLLAGGDFPLYLGNDSSTGQVVTGNVFSTMFFTTSGYYGTAYNTAPVPTWGANSNVWSGNTWYDGALAGQTVPPPELTVYEQGTFTDGGENVTIRPVITDTDSGAFTDTAYPTAHITDLDSGTGTDNASLTAHVAGADTGAGTDAAAVTAHISDSDYAAGTDATSLTAHISDGDTAAATDQWEDLSTTIHDGDTGTGTDTAVAPNLGKADTDTGTFTDTAHIGNAIITDSDSGSFTDTAASHTTITDSDSFTGTDSVPFLQANVHDTESGAFTESATSGGRLVTGSDTGTFYDQAQVVSAVITDSDTGTFTDTQTLFSSSHGHMLAGSPVHPFVTPIGQVSATASSAWDVNASRVHVTGSSTWTLDDRTSADASSHWDTLVPVTTTTNAASDWDILGHVTLIESVAWAVNDRRTRLVSSTYETLQSADQTGATAYLAMFRLSASVNALSKWVTVGRTSATCVASYNVRTSATAKGTSTYNVLFGASVTKTGSSAWGVTARSQTLIESATWNMQWRRSIAGPSAWETLKHLTLTGAVSYRVRSRLDTSDVSRWTTVGRANSSIEYVSYLCRAKITVSARSTYDIGLSFVTKTAASSWETRAQASKTGAAGYNVAALARISASDSAGWSVTGRSNAAGSVAWNVVKRLLAPGNVSWMTDASAAQTYRSTYQTRARTMVLGGSQWNVRNPAAQTGTAGWVTIGRTSASLTALWDTDARTAKAGTSNWDVYYRITTTTNAASAYNVLGRTTLTGDASWELTKRMDTTQPVKYTTLGRVPPAGASGVFRGSCGGRLQNADNSSTAGAGILAYEAWLGHDVSYVIDYITTVPTTWAQFENAYCDQNDPTFKYISQWDWLSQPGRWTMMLGVPTCCGVTTGSGARTWAQEAAGDSDEHWTALGNNLVSWGMGNAVLRIGREWNGNWYNWSPCKTGDSISEYILGNMHIVDVLREVPGQSFQFMWNPTLGMVSGESGSNAEATKWYPGSNYVDIVGLDYYDFSSNSNYPTQTHTPYGNRSAASQAANFNYVYNQDDGFLGWINFAKWVGKPFALPEWGLELWLSGGNYSGGGDNDYFINQMASICKGTSMQAMWEDTGEGLYDTDSCPRRTSGLTVDASRNLYLEKFGGATPSLGRLTVDDSGDGNVTGGVGGSGDDDAPPIYPSGGTTCEIAWNVDVPVSVTPAPAAWDTYQRVTVTGSSTFNEVQRPGLIYLAAWNTYTYPGPVEFAVAWNVAGYDGEEQIQLMGSDMMKEME